MELQSSWKQMKHWHRGEITVNGQRVQVDNTLELIGLKYIRVASLLNSSHPAIPNYEISYLHHLQVDKFTTSIKYKVKDINVSAGVLLQTGYNTESYLRLETNFKQVKKILITWNSKTRSWAKGRHTSTAEIDMWNTKTSLNNELEWSGTSFISGTVRLQSPIKGYETVQIKLFHQNDRLNFTDSAQVQLNQKLYLWKSAIQLNTNKKTANIVVKTPFEGYEHLIAQGLHEQLTYGFRNQLTAGQPEKPLLTSDAKWSVEPSGRVEVAWDFSSQIQSIRQIKVTYDHYGIFPKCNSNLYISASVLRKPITFTTETDLDNYKRRTLLQMTFDAPKVGPVSSGLKWELTEDTLDSKSLSGDLSLHFEIPHHMKNGWAVKAKLTKNKDTITANTNVTTSIEDFRSIAAKITYSTSNGNLHASLTVPKFKSDRMQELLKLDYTMTDTVLDATLDSSQMTAPVQLKSTRSLQQTKAVYSAEAQFQLTTPFQPLSSLNSNIKLVIPYNPLTHPIDCSLHVQLNQGTTTKLSIKSTENLRQIDFKFETPFDTIGKGAIQFSENTLTITLNPTILSQPITYQHVLTPTQLKIVVTSPFRYLKEASLLANYNTADEMITGQLEVTHNMLKDKITGQFTLRDNELTVTFVTPYDGVWKQPRLTVRWNQQDDKQVCTATLKADSTEMMLKTEHEINWPRKLKASIQMVVPNFRATVQGKYEKKQDSIETDLEIKSSEFDDIEYSGSFNLNKPTIKIDLKTPLTSMREASFLFDVQDKVIVKATVMDKVFAWNLGWKFTEDIYEIQSTLETPFQEAKKSTILLQVQPKESVKLEIESNKLGKCIGSANWAVVSVREFSFVTQFINVLDKSSNHRFEIRRQPNSAYMKINCAYMTDPLELRIGVAEDDKDFYFSLATPFNKMKFLKLVTRRVPTEDGMRHTVQFDNDYTGKYEYTADFKVVRGIYEAKITLQSPNTAAQPETLEVTASTAFFEKLLIQLQSHRVGTYKIQAYRTESDFFFEVSTPHQKMRSITIKAKRVDALIRMELNIQDQHLVTFQITNDDDLVRLETETNIDGWRKVGLTVYKPVLTKAKSSMGFTVYRGEMSTSVICQHNSVNGITGECTLQNTLLPKLPRFLQTTIQHANKIGSFKVTVDEQTPIAATWEKTKLSIDIKPAALGKVVRLLVGANTLNYRELTAFYIESQYGELSHKLSLKRTDTSFGLKVNCGADEYLHQFNWHNAIDLKSGEIVLAINGVDQFRMAGRWQNTDQRSHKFLFRYADYQLVDVEVADLSNDFKKEYGVKFNMAGWNTKWGVSNVRRLTTQESAFKWYISREDKLLNEGMLSAFLEQTTSKTSLNTEATINGALYSVKMQTNRRSTLMLHIATPYPELGCRMDYEHNVGDREFTAGFTFSNEKTGTFSTEFQVKFTEGFTGRFALRGPSKKNIYDIRVSLSVKSKEISLTAESKLFQADPFKVALTFNNRNKLEAQLLITTPIAILKKLHVEVKGNMLSDSRSTVTFKYRGWKDITLTMMGSMQDSTTFSWHLQSGTNTLAKMKFSYSGNLAQMNHVVLLSFGGEQIGYEIDGGFQPLFIGNLSVYTAIAGMKTIRLTGNRVDANNRFNVDYRLQYSKDQAIQIRFDQGEEDKESIFEMSTPFAGASNILMGVSYSRSGRQVRASTRFEWGDHKSIRLTGEHTPMDEGYRGRFTFNSPWWQSKQVAIDIHHQAKDDDLMFDHGFRIDEEKPYRLYGNLSRRNEQTTGRLAFHTPNNHYSLDLEHSGKLRQFQNAIKFNVGNEQKLHVRSKLDIVDKFHTDWTISAPSLGIHSVNLVVRHEGQFHHHEQMCKFTVNNVPYFHYTGRVHPQEGTNHQIKTAYSRLSFLALHTNFKQKSGKLNWKTLQETHSVELATNAEDRSLTVTTSIQQVKKIILRYRNEPALRHFALEWNEVGHMRTKMIKTPEGNYQASIQTSFITFPRADFDSKFNEENKEATLTWTSYEQKHRVYTQWKTDRNRFTGKFDTTFDILRFASVDIDRDSNSYGIKINKHFANIRIENEATDVAVSLTTSFHILQKVHLKSSRSFNPLLLSVNVNDRIAKVDFVKSDTSIKAEIRTDIPGWELLGFQFSLDRDSKMTKIITTAKRNNDQSTFTVKYSFDTRRDLSLEVNVETPFSRMRQASFKTILKRIDNGWEVECQSGHNSLEARLNGRFIWKMTGLDKRISFQIDADSNKPNSHSVKFETDFIKSKQQAKFDLKASYIESKAAITMTIDPSTFTVLTNILNNDLKIELVRTNGYHMTISSEKYNKRFNAFIQISPNQLLLKMSTPFLRIRTFQFQIFHRQTGPVSFEHKCSLTINDNLLYETDFKMTGSYSNFKFEMQKPKPFTVSFRNKGSLTNNDMAFSLNCEPTTTKRKVELATTWNFEGMTFVTIMLTTPHRNFQFSTKTISKDDRYFHQTVIRPNAVKEWALLIQSESGMPYHAIVTTPVGKFSSKLVGNFRTDGAQGTLEILEKIKITFEVAKTGTRRGTKLAITLPHMTQPVIIDAQIDRPHNQQTAQLTATIKFSNKVDDHIAFSAKVFRENSRWVCTSRLLQNSRNIDVNVKIEAESADNLAGLGFQFDYTTAEGERKFLRFKKTITWQNQPSLQMELTTHFKSILATFTMARTAAGYRFAMSTAVDNIKVIHGYVETSNAPGITLRFHYDHKRPDTYIEMYAKYLNENHMQTEVYTITQKGKATEFLISFKLKSDHRLGTRFIWHPTSLKRLSAFTTTLYNTLREEMTTTQKQMMQAVQQEIQRRRVQLREMLPNYDGVSLYVSEEYHKGRQQMRDLGLELTSMYDSDDFYTKTIMSKVSVPSVIRRPFRAAVQFINRFPTYGYIVYDNIQEIPRQMLNMLYNTYTILEAASDLIYTPLNQLVSRLLQPVNNWVKDQITRVMDSIRPIVRSILNKFEDRLDAFIPAVKNYLKDVLPLLNKTKSVVTIGLRQLRDLLERMAAARIDYLPFDTELKKLLTYCSNQIDLHVTALNAQMTDFVTSVDTQIEKYFWFNLRVTNHLLTEMLRYVKWTVENTVSQKTVTDFIYAQYKQFVTYYQEYYQDLLVDLIRPNVYDITLYDSEKGIFEGDLFLPIPMHNLKTKPDFSVIQKKMKKLDLTWANMKRSFAKSLEYKSMTATFGWILPDFGLSGGSWMPTFQSFASISDNQVITFDKRHFKLQKASCDMTLVEDKKTNRWSVKMKNDNGKVLTIVAYNKKIEIRPNFEVRVDTSTVELPYTYNSLKVLRLGRMIKVSDDILGYTITGDPVDDVYTVGVTNWYHGQLRGLFGNMDNEPYNDFMNNEGKLVEPNDFLAAYTERTCSNMDIVKTPQQTDEDRNRRQRVCKFLFKCPVSPLSRCFRNVDPQPFYQMCVEEQEGPEKTQVCRSVRIYAAHCKLADKPVFLPRPCRRCHLESTQEVLASSEPVTTVTQQLSADVVFVVQEDKCMASMKPHLSQLADRLQAAFSRVDIAEVRFGLIGYGDDRHNTLAHVHTINNRHFGSKREFTAALNRMDFTNEKQPADHTEAVLTAAKYPFRPTASRHIIMLPCSACRTLPWTAWKMRDQLRQNGINFNVLLNFTFGYTPVDNGITAFGVNSERLFTARQPAGLTFRLERVPKPNSDSCYDFAMATGGVAFDSNHLQKPSSSNRERFMDILTQQVASRARPATEAQCQCNEEGLSVCTPTTFPPTFVSRIPENFSPVDPLKQR